MTAGQPEFIGFHGLHFSLPERECAAECASERWSGRLDGKDIVHKAHRYLMRMTARGEGHRHAVDDPNHDPMRRYLDDPVYATMYAGELRSNIERVVQQMDRLRAELDRPPAPRFRPSEDG
jgi:hypothetical protein